MLKIAQSSSKLAKFPKTTQFCSSCDNCSKLLETVQTCLQLKRVMMFVKDVCMLFLRWLTIIWWPVAPLESFVFVKWVGASSGAHQFWRNRIIIWTFGYFWVFNPAGSNTCTSGPWNDIGEQSSASAYALPSSFSRGSLRWPVFVVSAFCSRLVSKAEFIETMCVRSPCVLRFQMGSCLRCRCGQSYLDAFSGELLTSWIGAQCWTPFHRC